MLGAVSIRERGVLCRHVLDLGVVYGYVPCVLHVSLAGLGRCLVSGC